MKYTGEYTREISFPLGGIGTGSIGLGGNGRLVDWEIFNRPSKGSISGYSHFAIKATAEGESPVAYILNGDINKDFMGEFSDGIGHSGFGYGPSQCSMCGFPHFKNHEFNGEFPVAEISFSDDNFPSDVKMTAFNPLIPSDSFNSSIPAAFFEIEVKNTSKKALKYQIALNARNPFEKSVNKPVKKNGITMINMLNGGCGPDGAEYGDITISTDCPVSYGQEYWYRGGWQDGVVTYWNEFSSNGNLRDRHYDNPGFYDTGAIVACVEAKPGECTKARFVISWNVPNCYNYWKELKDENGNYITWKNYYATVFTDSIHSSVYSLENFESLKSRTMKFKNALYGSTLPEKIIDAAGANLSVLKSPTVLRLEDGTFYGWEGVSRIWGSCEGTCQHVWNYAYALCFLFPDLERSIRDAEFTYSTSENGSMVFRTKIPLGCEEYNAFRPCVDGQMGSVFKSYREWKISGNNDWLRKNWETIKKVMEYTWSSENPDRWDADMDGCLEGRQHHTLDMELFGPSSWLQSMYLTALLASSEMAEFMGDTVFAEKCRGLYEKGYEWTKDNLFNGRYFVQKVDVTDKSVIDSFDAAKNYWNDEVGQIKYQIADGSSIDQMLGQWHATLLGLGDVFDENQVKTALSNMMKYNFKSTMRNHTNPWRIFSVNDEAGSVICVYPEDCEKPAIPVPYCEETMTGFEYSFAGLLMQYGMIEEGVRVAGAVRDRFNGKLRNPWNEFECGSNYARSMASYSFIPILSGFEFDLPKFHIGFNPYKKDEFRCVWSVDGAYGEFEISGNKAELSVIEGKLELSSLGLAFADSVKSLTVDGRTLDFKFESGCICFEKTVITDGIEIVL